MIVILFITISKDYRKLLNNIKKLRCGFEIVDKAMNLLGMYCDFKSPLGLMLIGRNEFIFKHFVVNTKCKNKIVNKTAVYRNGLNIMIKTTLLLQRALAVICDNTFVYGGMYICITKFLKKKNDGFFKFLEKSLII